MDNFNDIGISAVLDPKRIKKLLSIGLFASLLHLAGGLILGWGTENESLTGVARLLSAYSAASDKAIFTAALLGLFGMTLEALSMFGIYRLIVPDSPSLAHSFRSGIFGWMLFCPCGIWVSVCAAAFLVKHGFEQGLTAKFAGYFILPSFILFCIFFAVLEAAQIKAFAKGFTPYPKFCAVFCAPVGILAALLFRLFGNTPLANAMTCSVLAVGSLWTFAGLLITMKKSGFQSSER